MKLSVDYLLIGTGAAPLLAAQRLSNRGDTVAILNPDSDFFLENSELPLDLMNFESITSYLSKRFTNNLPEQVYRDLSPEFPGAIELWKGETQQNAGDFQVEGAPWIHSRYRMWVAPERSARVDRLENLYLRMLDLGWKPQWLEGVSLAKRFPGFSSRDLESRDVGNWVGFLGPRFADVDVARYRTGLLEFVRERLGRENIHTSAHILDIDEKGVRFQLATGLPQTLQVGRAVLYVWTPKMERILKQNLEKYQPRALAQFQAANEKHLWDEWDLLSRDPVNPSVVAHLDGIRVWSHGEGEPPIGGWNRVKIMRRNFPIATHSNHLLGEQSFQEISRLIFNFLGWERFTVRNMTPRQMYRWHHTSPIEYDSDGVRTLIIHACDGPLHWIAQQVRQTIDGI